MKRLFFFIIVNISLYFVYSEQLVVLPSGNPIIIKDNKTWYHLPESDLVLETSNAWILLHSDGTWIMLDGKDDRYPADGKIGLINKDINNTLMPQQIGFAFSSLSDAFDYNIYISIVKNAMGKVEVVDSQNSQPTQNDQVDAFLSKKMKAIAINPVDRTAAAAIIEKAKAKKTPVVFFNREPLPEDMAAWDKVYYVGAKAEQSGTMQGQIVVDYWKANPAADKNKDGKIQYIMLKGEPGHQYAELRTKFSIQAVTDAGIEVEEIAEDTAMWDRPKAFEKMKAFYAAYGDKIEVVFCNNDEMALGSIEALESDGYFAGGKQVVVVGVDATAPALQAVEEGTLLGTVLNDSKNQGKAIFDLAYALAKGEDVTKAGWEIADGKYVWVPYQMVTKENYTQFK